MVVNYYEVLGVHENATINDLREAFRRRIKEEMPGRGGDREQTILVNEAWNVLSDENSKSFYDAYLKAKSFGEVEKSILENFEQCRFKAEEKSKRSPIVWTEVDSYLDNMKWKSLFINNIWLIGAAVVLGLLGLFFFQPIMRAIYQSAYPFPVMITSSFDPSLIYDHEVRALVLNEGSSGDIAIIISQDGKRWIYVGYFQAKEKKELRLPLPGASRANPQLSTCPRSVLSSEDNARAIRFPSGN